MLMIRFTSDFLISSRQNCCLCRELLCFVKEEVDDKIRSEIVSSKPR